MDASFVESQANLVPVSQDAAARDHHRSQSRRTHLLILLALTLFGGGLRFLWLDHPPLWGDEGATYSRVSGTYQELLDILQYDGFMPLHYSAYWALGQVTRLEPVVMRLIPATLGTLMVPAIYFLAVQLVTRRAALLAAAFTACSAYMLIYSRDAKMYMQLWFFATLHMGCFFWWLRTKQRIAWIGWITAGIATMGTHAPALLLLAIQPLALLTQRRHHWREGLLFLVGLIVIGSGPAVYFSHFNKWQERTGGLVPGTVQAEDGRANWQWASGLAWIEDRNRGRSGPDLVLDSATAYLFAWEWPWADQRRGEPLLPCVQTTATVTITLLLILFAIGLMPWSYKAKGLATIPVSPRVEDPRCSEENGGEKNGDAASFKPSKKLAASPFLLSGPEAPPQEWWRSSLWLAAWLILPTYGFFYCRSVSDFVSPLHWIQSFGELFNHRWILLAAGIAALTLLVYRYPASARGLAMFLPLLILLLAYLALMSQPFRMENSDGEPISLLTRWFEQFLTMLRHPWLPIAAILILPPAIWHYSAPTHRERLIRLGQLTFIIAILFILCIAAYLYWDHQRTRALAERHTWASIWMPRYLGIIWPAVAITAAALLMRLPTRPLRWAAIAFLLGINLVNGIARITAATEPPMPLVAADIHTAHHDPAILAFTNSHRGGGPSQGWIGTWPGRYYLAMLDEADPSPHEFRHGPYFARFNPDRILNTNPAHIRRQLRRSGDVNTVIVWERLRHDAKLPEEEADPILAELQRLDPNWQRISHQTHPIREHWSWRSAGQAHRREYRKIDPPHGTGD